MQSCSIAQLATGLIKCHMNFKLVSLNKRDSLFNDQWISYPIIYQKLSIKLLSFCWFSNDGYFLLLVFLWCMSERGSLWMLRASSLCRSIQNLPTDSCHCSQYLPASTQSWYWGVMLSLIVTRLICKNYPIKRSRWCSSSKAFALHVYQFAQEQGSAALLYIHAWICLSPQILRWQSLWYLKIDGIYGTSNTLCTKKCQCC